MLSIENQQHWTKADTSAANTVSSYTEWRNKYSDIVFCYLTIYEEEMAKTEQQCWKN